MRLAGIVQGYLKREADKHENYKVVCWASSSVVVCGRRVCSVTDMRVTIEEGWWTADIWGTPKQAIEQELFEDHEWHTPRDPPPPTRTLICWTHNV